MVQIGVETLQSVEIDQAGQAVPLSQPGQMLNGFPGTLGERAGIIFAVQLLRVGHRLMQMNDLPFLPHLFVQDGKPAVHIDVDPAAFAVGANVKTAVHQAALLIHHLEVLLVDFSVKCSFFANGKRGEI